MREGLTPGHPLTKDLEEMVAVLGDASASAMDLAKLVPTSKQEPVQKPQLNRSFNAREELMQAEGNPIVRNSTW